MKAATSTYYLKVKFPTAHGIGEIWEDQVLARECYQVALASGENHSWMIDEPKPISEPSEVSQDIKVVPRDPSNVLKIKSALSATEKTKITTLLRENHDFFARKHKNMSGIDREIIQHHLNINPECKPV